MERGFKYLIDKYNEDGARKTFEDVCVGICQEMYENDAQGVRVEKGDGGIDVIVGNLPHAEKIFQCKFFPDHLGESQKNQIRESFNTVMNLYTMNEWILCVPLVLSQNELMWWSKWKKSKEDEYNIKISIWNGEYIINKLKKYKMYDSLFDDDIRESLEKILDEMSEYKTQVINEIIYGYQDEDNIIQNYQEYIFVKMLESAQIIDVDDCVIDFYNAEISKASSISKDAVNGMKVYKNLRSKINSVWKTQYRLYKQPNDGNELLGKVYQRIEDLDNSTLRSTEDYSLLAKKGILHQLADEKQIGWIENYVEKLMEYMKNYEI